MNLEVLTQLAQENPTEAAHTLALAFHKALQDDNKLELVRVASIAKELAQPLTPEFGPLLFYAHEES